MRRTVGGLAAMAILAGCSSATAPSPVRTSGSTSTTSATTAPTTAAPPECPAALRDAFAAAAKTGAVVVYANGSPGYISCDYHDQEAASGTCTGATVTINDQPQAYKDFQRWVVESGQTAGQGNQPDLAPVQENAGIGIESDWIQPKLNFEAASFDRWVAVFLVCPTPSAAYLLLAEDL